MTSTEKDTERILYGNTPCKRDVNLFWISDYALQGYVIHYPRSEGNVTAEVKRFIDITFKVGLVTHTDWLKLHTLLGESASHALNTYIHYASISLL